MHSGMNPIYRFSTQSGALRLYAMCAYVICLCLWSARTTVLEININRSHKRLCFWICVSLQRQDISQRASKMSSKWIPTRCECSGHFVSVNMWEQQFFSSFLIHLWKLLCVCDWCVWDPALCSWHRVISPCVGWSSACDLYMIKICCSGRWLLPHRSPESRSGLTLGIKGAPSQPALASLFSRSSVMSRGTARSHQRWRHMTGNMWLHHTVRFISWSVPFTDNICYFTFILSSVSEKCLSWVRSPFNL